MGPSFSDFADSSLFLLTQLRAKSPNLRPKRCPMIPTLGVDMGDLVSGVELLGVGLLLKELHRLASISEQLRIVQNRRALPFSHVQTL